MRLVIVGLVVSCLAVTACRQSHDELPSGPSTDNALDARVDDVAPTFDGDTQSSSPEDIGPVSRDVEPDVDVREPLPDFDPELWRTRECFGVETLEPVSDKPFEMPERTNPDPTLTEEEVLEQAPAAHGARMAAARALQPGSNYVYDLFSPGGREVQLYFYSYTDRTDHELSFEQTNMTVLVNYRPVQAEWTRWNAGRTERLLQATGTGVDFAPPKQVELIDITIPREAFPTEGVYDISFGMHSASSTLSPQTITWRLALYNGGYDRRTRPCTPPPIESDYQPIETALLGAALGGHALLIFPENIGWYSQARGEPIRAAGGTTLTFYASAYRLGGHPRVTVAQPTVNGVPTGEPHWYQQGGPTATHRFKWIDDRFTFDVTIPDEPGQYDVVVMNWETPYEVYRDLDGTRLPRVTNGVRVAKHSNPIRFVVEE